MPVLGLISVTLEVPKLEQGIEFYTDAGLVCDVDGAIARFRCEGLDRPSITLRSGYPRKRLHHVTLRAHHLTEVAQKVAASAGRIVSPPRGYVDVGVWAEDPHGGLFHLVERKNDAPLPAAAEFQVNAPGRIVRSCRSAMRPRHSYGRAQPLRLGHVLLFTPNVLGSVHFMTEALGMALADQSQDVIAFCCARKDSDHHVVAFAKSNGVGFHHASFQVAEPDDVGRWGQALVDKSQRGSWGFGRHTIGSNFFHYIQDPWGSWFEYYSDLDFIDDYSQWTPTNYELVDSLANWGPQMPQDFVHNYESEIGNYIAPSP